MIQYVPFWNVLLMIISVKIINDLKVKILIWMLNESGVELIDFYSCVGF